MRYRALPIAILLLLPLALASCRTVGASRTRGGFALLAPPVAHEMMLDNRTLIVLDVRPTDQYNGEMGHIAGAVSTPLSNIESRLPGLMPFRSSTIVVYGDDKEEAERGARLLVAAGFKNIVMLKGGIRRWMELGYRTVNANATDEIP